MKILRIGCIVVGFLSLVLSLFAQTPNSNDPDNNPLANGGATAIAELTASDGVALNTFGFTVAASGNTVVVGGCTELTTAPTCASRQDFVYVYEKPESGWGDMVQTAELTPSDGVTGDQFGESVAISGNTIVVGAQNGKAYVFVMPPGGWTDMTETAQLNPESGNGVGVQVSIDQNTIVVGVPTATVKGNDDQGAAYVFVEPPTGWATTSVPNAKLTASDGSYQDFFGLSVAVSENTIIVGAPFHHQNDGPGEVYVFEKPPAGWANATQTAKLTRSKAGQYDEFGFAVSINGSTVVVGAPQAVGANHGAGVVDVFVKPSKGWSNGTQNAELVAPISIQRFGWSVAIEGTKVTVGTNSTDNVVFVYAKPSTGGWKSTSKPQTELKAGNGVALFGFSVAMTNGIIVAGAPYEAVDGHFGQGAAYLFSE